VRFYLGTHQVCWLERTSVPLFVSHRRLHERRRFPRATAPWCLDSGGFTELSMHGEWRTTARQYAEKARLYQQEIGRLVWASPQDWMCEPSIREQTQLTVADHQQRTIDSYLDLQGLAPDVPWVPVLQGWEPTDYLRHVDMYSHRGIDLTALPAVGVGTVCRRQATTEGIGIIRALARLGLRLHAFGFKQRGLAAAADCLVSADSMAWSFRARRSPPLPGCTHSSCASCMKYALRWRENLLNHIHQPPAQLELFA
jgi:hypothetical protein